MDDAIEQRRLTRTIVNGVDVGLVAIDAQGVYDSMNPRHEEFMKLAYPSGHGGRAGQVGFAYAVRRRHDPRARRHAHGSSDPWRGLPRPADLGRRGPGRAARAGGVLHAVLPNQRGLRRGRARLPRHHRAGARLPDQGGVRRLGQPRAANTADLDHRVRRHHARRGGSTALGRVRPPRHGAAQRPPVAPPRRRPPLDGAAVGHHGPRRVQGSRGRPVAPFCPRGQPGRGLRWSELRVRRLRGAERAGDPRRRRTAGSGLRQPVQQRRQVHPGRRPRLGGRRTARTVRR